MSVNYNTYPAGCAHSAEASEALAWQGKGQTQGHQGQIRAVIKDTYTFLINYLLLSQLRHAASELFLLLPTAVHAVLRSLAARIVIGSARCSARLASASEASITCTSILATEACCASRLLLLEVGQRC